MVDYLGAVLLAKWNVTVKNLLFCAALCVYEMTVG